jgi:signal peptidase II
MHPSLKSKIPPLALAAGVIAADQASKAAIVAASGGQQGVLYDFLGGFLYIAHQRNLGAAFSLLDGLPEARRLPILGFLPLLVLTALLVYYLRSPDARGLQAWCLMAILGGGLGNLIDRFFRPLGVVDFISVKIYGLFGMERWPTFNIADAAVVVGGILLAVSLAVQGAADSKRRKEEAKA